MLDRDTPIRKKSDLDSQERGADAPSPPTRTTARVSSVVEDRHELEMFKRAVDLSAYAAARGYRLDSKESSQRTRVMRLDGDKINITRAPDGHYLYYSFRDLQDNGSIIDFIARRDYPHATRGQYPIGRIRQDLRRWTHTERSVPEFARTPLLPTTKDLALVEQMMARAQVQKSHPYLEARGLTSATLTDPRFRGTWSVATGYFREGQWQPLSGGRGNVLFPHHDERGLCGYEAKNQDFTGFAPGGEKALWASRVRATDNVLVITESAIDALSYHALTPDPRARYVSFAGQMNPRQPALLERAVSWMPSGSRVVAATDKDKDGHEYARRIAAICEQLPGITCIRHAPECGKDWNDQLRALRDRSKSLPAVASKGLDR